VSTFGGLAQYSRVAFTPGTDFFKSAIMMYRANHGQWNTGWNERDNGKLSGRRLTLDALISGEDQREFGRLVIGGFLDATLLGKTEYRSLFRDHRSAGDWLPPTMYSTRYADARERSLATFEDDIDLTTGSIQGVTLRGDSLSTWREFDLPFRSANSSQQNTVLRLGWNNTPAGLDSTPRWPARFTVALSDSLARALQVDSSSAVTLSLFYTDQTPGARKSARDSSGARDSASDSARTQAKRPAASRPKRAARDTTPPDLSVELVDAAGNTARLPLSSFGPVRRPIESFIYRRGGRDAQRFTSRYEQLLHTYVMPLREFARSSTTFDVRSVREIQLVFDKTRVGQVHVDDIGITRIP